MPTIPRARARPADAHAGRSKRRAAALLTRNGLIVAAVGDIDEAELARQLDRAFGGLPAGARQPPPPDWTPPTKPRTVVVERPVPQSAVLMALPGIAARRSRLVRRRRDEPHPGRRRQQSRLFNEVREKRGLAYGVSSALRTYKQGVAARGLDRERQRARRRGDRASSGPSSRACATEGVTEQELADAKTYLTGSLALSLDSSAVGRGPAARHAGRPPAARPSRPARRR